jgi:hypothetical protein
MNHRSSSFQCLLWVSFAMSGCFQSAELKFNDEKAARAAGRVPSSIAEDYSVTLPVAKRHYVESVFVQAFAIPLNDPDRATLKTAIYDKREFGGGCDRYGVSDTEVNGVIVAEFPRAQCSTAILPELESTSNPMRFAWTAKACENMIYSRPARFQGIMTQVLPGWVSGTPTAKPSPESVSRAYGLFFQGRAPEDEVLKALVALGESSSTSDEGWKLILTALCVSPEWQTY